MPDAELVQQVTDTALRLVSASHSGEVDGEDVARELGRDPSDPDAELFWVFKEIERRGDLDMYFRGGMGLPAMVRLPHGR